MKRKKDKEKIVPPIKIEEITIPSNIEISKLVLEIEELKINQKSMSDEIIKLKKALIYMQNHLNLLQGEILKNKKL